MYDKVTPNFPMKQVFGRANSYFEVLGVKPPQKN